MNQYEELFQRLEEKVNELGVEFNSPATKDTFKELEKTINQQLPKDILDFYSFCNGFDTKDHLFRILSIEEILRHKVELSPSTFYFAEYMIYSDYWTIQVNNSQEYSLLNSDHGYETEVILTTSIYEFLERYIIGGGIFGEKGLYNWFSELKNKST